MTHTILVVDDELLELHTIAQMLTKEDFEVITTQTAKDALDILNHKNVHIALLDVIMPNLNGIELLTKIKELKPTVAVIMMSGYATLDTVVEAIKCGAENYVLKPFDNTLILKVIKNVISSISSKKFTKYQEKLLDLIPLVNDYVLVR